MSVAVRAAGLVVAVRLFVGIAADQVEHVDQYRHRFGDLAGAVAVQQAGSDAASGEGRDRPNALKRAHDAPPTVRSPTQTPMRAGARR
jgi:hypothetical protein